MVDASERLQVLLKQEATIYVTSDYLSRMQSTKPMDADDTVPSDEDSESSPGSPNKKRKSLSCLEETITNNPSPPGQTSADGSANSQINKHWREKICEWAYQGKFQMMSLRAGQQSISKYELTIHPAMSLF